MKNKHKNFRFFDFGDSVLDRITIVKTNTRRQARTNIYYECIASCLTGVSFFTHGECELGEHLGKELQFNELTKELQDKLNNY